MCDLGQVISFFLEDKSHLSFTCPLVPKSEMASGQRTDSYLLSLQLGRPLYTNERADLVRREGQVQ